MHPGPGELSLGDVADEAEMASVFHGHVGSGSIDQALERLSSLGLVTSRYVPGRGRRTILWSAIDHQYQELMEEETAEPDESSEDLASLLSALSALSAHF